MTHDSDDLFSRNWAFISPALQQQLDRTCFFTAGTGLSSTIAVLACRTGFGSFILADGDDVELSNLNRQAFFRRHVGQNKAAATAELLRDIRPDIEVTVIPQFIENDSYLASLERANIIINSIDYDNPALFTLARDARARGIPMIIPLNLGWGGVVQIFTADSMPLEDYLGVEPKEAHNAAEISARLVTTALTAAPGGVPSYLAEALADFQVNGAQWPCEPQLGPTASLTAAMVVRAAVALVANEPVLVTPAVFHVDLRSLLERPASGSIVEPDGGQRDTQPAHGDGNLISLDAAHSILENGRRPRPAGEADTQQTSPAAAHPAEQATSAPAAVTLETAEAVETVDTVETVEATATMPASSAAGTQEHNASPAVRAIQKMPRRKQTDDDFRIYLRSRQQNARYPALTAVATKGKNLPYQRTRPSGLWAYAIRHDMLEADAFNEFGEFRLDQYALAGLYDTTKIAQRGYRTDPALSSVSEDTIHVLCGTNTGQILSCCSIIPPKGPLYSEPAGWMVKRRRPLVLADNERAVFPSEVELFGRGVFESLPEMQQVPIERIREIGHLMRNQAIKSPLTGIAVFELCYALTQVLTHPRLGIDIALGSSGPEARNLMELANIPILYAPWAQVVVSETTPEEDFWIPPPNAEGYFWPYVIATADLQKITPYLQQLDAALASPAQMARGAMIELSRQSRQSGLPQPQFVLQAQVPQRWFAGPPYGPPVPSASQAE